MFYIVLNNYLFLYHRPHLPTAIDCCNLIPYCWISATIHISLLSLLMRELPYSESFISAVSILCTIFEMKTFYFIYFNCPVNCSLWHWRLLYWQVMVRQNASLRLFYHRTRRLKDQLAVFGAIILVAITCIISLILFNAFKQVLVCWGYSHCRAICD